MHDSEYGTHVCIEIYLLSIKRNHLKLFADKTKPYFVCEKDRNVFVKSVGIFRSMDIIACCLDFHWHFCLFACSMFSFLFLSFILFDSFSLTLSLRLGKKEKNRESFFARDPVSFAKLDNNANNPNKRTKTNIRSTE